MLIAWDTNRNKDETLSQNYARLGLVAKLGTTAGGVEKRAGAKKPAKDRFRVKSITQAVVGEAKVERDADGKIVRIVRPGQSTTANPLRDPLSQFDTDEEADEDDGDDGEEWGGLEDDDDDGEARTEVVRQLEEEASRPVEPTVRRQSSREVEWLERLVAKHGDDTLAMARDIKLNPMQQTKADIAKRLKKAGLLPA